MVTPRLHLSEAIKRAVRKNCFFGCVLCGLPIFEYDHIEEYSTNQEHNVDNLILLCPNHHAKKSKRLISVQKLQKARCTPFNSTRVDTPSDQVGLPDGDDFSVLIGTNTFSYTSFDGMTYPILIVEAKSYISLTREESDLLLSLEVPDGKGGALLKIDKGELKVSTGAWDFRRVGTNIEVWSRPRQIFLRMAFKPSLAVIERIEVVGNYGVRVSIKGDGVTALNRDGAVIHGTFSKSQYANVAFCIANKGIYHASVDRSGQVLSTSHVEELRRLFELACLEHELTLRISMLFDVEARLPRTSAAHFDDSTFDLAIRVRDEQLKYFNSGPTFKRLLYNRALCLYHWAGRTSDLGLVEDALATVKSLVAAPPDAGYDALELAQAETLYGRVVVLAAALGVDVVADEIAEARLHVERARETYNKQSQRFLHIIYPGTTEMIDSAIASLSKLAQK